jgi:hypothetical protein
MITYSGKFDLALMVSICRDVAHMHLNKNNVDESEVPVSNEAGEIKYLQFLLVSGSWVYVGIRK